MRAAALLLAGALAAVPAAAAEPPGLARVEEARALLEEAETALARAESRIARREALQKAVEAHEAALGALRAGLRALAAEDRRLTRDLAAERTRLAGLLGALQGLSLAPRSALLAHPGGALEAARSAQVIADMTPRLRARLEEAGRRIDALRSVRLGQEIARAEARGALAALQALRAEANRRRGGRRYREVRAALMRQSEEAAARAADLDDLARTLRAALPLDTGARPFEQTRGTLPPPVAGRVTARYGAPDPWGRPGEGLSWTAPAHAEVTAPVDGTVRYAGPLIDYGEVVILEPEEGWLLVLAGLARAERRVGETVLAGERLGALGGPLPQSEEFLLEAGGSVPQVRTTDLYLELRRSGTAVDPAPWFEDTSE
jgi:septal ring factor EnvC (AmiA/AmiB activator)